MKYDEVKDELHRLGFVYKSNHDPEGEMFELIKDKNTIYACISYPFMETWRHEGASGKRIWFTAVHDIEITLNKLIEWENISITE